MKETFRISQSVFHPLSKFGMTDNTLRIKLEENSRLKIKVLFKIKNKAHSEARGSEIGEELRSLTNLSLNKINLYGFTNFLTNDSFIENAVIGVKLPIGMY